MKEKKIPLSEAYVKAQRFEWLFVEIGGLVACMVVIGGLLSLELFTDVWFELSDFGCFYVFGFLSGIVALMAALYRRSLSERYELYKTMKQHLAEEHGGAT
jgi:hypothetical protein